MLDKSLLSRCERERDEALRDARRLRAAARAFLNAYAHDIGWQDELKALEKVVNGK